MGGRIQVHITDKQHINSKALNVPQKKDLYPDPILSENLELDPDQFLSVEKGSISRSYPRSDPF